MQHSHAKWARDLLIVLAVALSTVGVLLAQAQPRSNRGRVRNQGGVALKKARPDAADPLAKAGAPDAKAKTKAAETPAIGTYHYTFKLHSFDGTALAASYYPSKLGSAAPVVLLVHEAGRSRKDFEDAITDQKGAGLAEHLQREGYAVLSLDLRGQGQNPRRSLTPNDRSLLSEDLQAAYVFLLDRHNRGDLNIARFGVIALAAGANLSVAWAYQPGAAVSTEGRPSDLNALVLVSPLPEGSGYTLRELVPSLAPRVPLALLAGDKDNASKNAIESVRKSVERARLCKIESFPSSLQGYKLLRLEPKVVPAIMRFLENTIKLRPVEWEPRYNLTPITVSDIVTVRPAKTPEKAAARKGQAKEEPKNAAPAKDDAKPKAKPAGDDKPEPRAE
jgi:pimeloyl-ACP methyl ester carboxylesterase